MAVRRRLSEGWRARVAEMRQRTDQVAADTAARAHGAFAVHPRMVRPAPPAARAHGDLDMAGVRIGAAAAPIHAIPPTGGIVGRVVRAAADAIARAKAA
ncbi:hypothetical protein [Roseomonas sp. CECT 9278]|uniref:hypothetical protein n=1 Tax=Roseomonas sp. CECT 9278 TaxID=2845823 RepID=UPI001E5C46B3|nr:hypothetical protein [Roseomonas sp. CECT 9278]CAH0232638.1 hypothetical protein ROS9278_02691 [Roseomonas sp. CECT 9278]